VIPCSTARIERPKLQAGELGRQAAGEVGCNVSREQVRSVGPLALVGLCLWPRITLARSRSDLAGIDADLARVVDLKIDGIKRRSTIGDRVSEATASASFGDSALRKVFFGAFRFLSFYTATVKGDIVGRFR
jgi:hypothetical protein